jgi:hypothetical protein
MATWEVWVEGYEEAPGPGGKAWKAGIGKGRTFKAACVDLASRSVEFRKNFRGDNLTWWGCRLFPSETEARKEFG